MQHDSVAHMYIHVLSHYVGVYTGDDLPDNQSLFVTDL